MTLTCIQGHRGGGGGGSIKYYEVCCAVGTYWPDVPSMSSELMYISQFVSNFFMLKGLGTCCNFLTSAPSGLPQVAIQIIVLAAHVATLNRSPRNPIPNKENSRGTIRDFSFAQAMGHRVIQNAALWLATTLQLSCRVRNSPYRPANRLQALRVCCREACDCCRPGIAGCNRRKLQRVPGP